MKPISAPRIARISRSLQLEQIVPAVEARSARPRLAGRLNEAQNRQRGHRLAASGLADEAQRFAAAQLEADMIDRANDPVEPEGGGQAPGRAGGVLSVICRRV